MIKMFKDHLNLAIAFVRDYKREMIIVTISLLVMSTGRLIAFAHFGDSHPLVVFQGGESLSIPSLLLAVLVTGMGFLGLLYVYYCFGKALPKKTLTTRLLLVFGASLVVSLATSLAMGYFAQALAAGDALRFDLAKTGVDHASGILGVIKNAAYFTALAVVLRRNKVSSQGVAATFAILLLWAAPLYLIDYVLLHLGFGTTGEVLHVIISTATTLWLMAVAFGLQTGLEDDYAEELPGAEGEEL